jgi:hypothetical protein
MRGAWRLGYPPEALARRIVETALDESTGVKGASLGLRLIDAIDPPVEASVTVELPKTPEDVDAMPYDDFIRLCAQLGLDTGGLPKPR